ncbi:hypothetical protein PsYK624_150830 [Phanerochaete sordida]|uniref:Uncharacterized protein n=1 Tax=Phanerochaete sordida TaxID=48140 RepID=A0A9P3LKT3_9APHY|nr:hypothetical protein PsYK624_150830 [Phanerochaete sordida]
MCEDNGEELGLQLEYMSSPVARVAHPPTPPRAPQPPRISIRARAQHPCQTRASTSGDAPLSLP